jgi:hypothetical protein
MLRRCEGLVIALAGLLALAQPSFGWEVCFTDGVRLSADEDGLFCEALADTPGQTLQLHLFAWLATYQHDPPIEELAFEIDGFPMEGVVVDVEWLVPPTSGGEAFNGTHVWHFDPPLAYGEQLGELARISVYIEQPLAMDHWVAVRNGRTIDTYGQIFPMRNEYFTFNCTGIHDWMCYCTPLGCPSYPWLKFEAIDPPPGAFVDGEFTLGFAVTSCYCDNYQCVYAPISRSFTGVVEVNGEVVGSFAGSGHEEILVPLSTADWPPGSDLAVTLRAANQHGEWSVDFEYGTDAGIPVSPESWSRIKARY